MLLSSIGLRKLDGVGVDVLGCNWSCCVVNALWALLTLSLSKTSERFSRSIDKPVGIDPKPLNCLPLEGSVRTHHEAVGEGVNNGWTEACGGGAEDGRALDSDALLG